MKLKKSKMKLSDYVRLGKLSVKARKKSTKNTIFGMCFGLILLIPMLFFAVAFYTDVSDKVNEVRLAASASLPLKNVNDLSPATMYSERTSDNNQREGVSAFSAYDSLSTLDKLEDYQLSEYRQLSFLVGSNTDVTLEILDNNYNTDSATVISVSSENGGTAYRDQIITLTESDVLCGSIYKTVMLIPKNQTLVEISLPASMYVHYQSSPQNSIRAYNKNGKHFFVIAENSDVTFYFSAPANGNYIYYGQRLVKASELAENYYLHLDTTDIQRSIRITATPYMSDSGVGKMAIGEEGDDGEYIPFAYCDYYGQLWAESLFGLNRSYRVCTLGGDGKIRYKDIDVASIPFGDWRYELAIEFDDSYPVVELVARLTDVSDTFTDFAGVLIYFPEHYGSEPQLLGRIDSGNELVLTEGIRFEQLVLRGLPEGYYSYEPTEDSAFYSELMLNGIYNIYCAPQIDLHVHFDYSGSLEGIRVDGYSPDNYYYEFFIDSNNNVIIEDFSFAVSYTVHGESLSWVSLWLNSLIGDFSNIRYENGIYSITLRLTR